MSDYPDRFRRPEPASPQLPTARIRTPDEIIRAVPYLLGFHPRESLVLLALRGKTLVLTVRLDLSDAAGADPTPLRDTLDAVARARADRLLGVVVTDTPVRDATGALGAADRTSTGRSAGTGAGRRLPYADLVDHLDAAATGFALELTDALLLHADRWWSYLCEDPTCCPPMGRPIDTATSPFEALAVTYGTVPLDSRDELERLLDPVAKPVSAEEIERAVRALRRRVTAAARTQNPTSWQGPVIDELLVAARTPERAITATSAARWGTALQLIPVRDAAWLATDSGQGPDPQWWRALGRMLPAPFCAAPLFLFGWAAWRAGHGAMANVCVARILAADPDYSAGRLLDQAVRSGMNPHAMPPMTLST